MNRRRLPAVLLLAALGLLVAPAPAQAHPLGNFTTNQYAGLRVTADGLDVDYLLDLAELPTYQARQDTIDTDGDGTENAAERDRYATDTCVAAAAATTITIDGGRAAVTARPVALTFPSGTGGLATMRLQCVLHAAGRPADGTTIAYRSGYLTDRIGWREVTAVGDSFTVTRSSVPATSISARLTAYPTTAPTSDVRAAELTVRPGGPPAAPIVGDATAAATFARGVDRFTRWFTDLIGHPRLTWGVGVLAFLVAFVLGGAHAVAPGHGKTIMAAYLIGTRGRRSHALAVAGTVAVTHTIGVLALGLVLALSLEVAPDLLYDWLRVASGVLVAAVGGQLLRHALRAARTRRAAAAHAAPTQDHAAPTHVHDHAEPAHAHADPAHAHAYADSAHVHAHAGLEHAHAGHSHSHAVGPHDHGQGAHAHVHADHPAADGPAPGAHVHSGPDAAPHGAGQMSVGEPHSHGGGLPHTHYLPAPDEPLRMRTLLAMGFAGGLSPSPSAVVVLLGAAALGRAWYGVVLVVAYGIGLAAVLTGIGFALARWGERLRGIGSGRIARLCTERMPTVTAAAILAVGLGMVTLAIGEMVAGQG